MIKLRKLKSKLETFGYCERLPSYSELYRDSCVRYNQSLLTDSESDLNSNCSFSCDLLVAAKFQSNIEKNKKKTTTELSLPISKNEIRKAIFEDQQRSFECNKLVDIELSSMLRYQLKTTFETTTELHNKDLNKTQAAVITGDRKAKISDAYTESTENFPDTYLALCSGKKLSERISTSKYLSPLSYDECLNSKIAAASLDFLNRHRELEQQDNRVIKQRDRICVLPILRITYIQEEKPKFLWIIGTNRKVYDPFLNH